MEAPLQSVITNPEGKALVDMTPEELSAFHLRLRGMRLSDITLNDYLDGSEKDDAPAKESDYV